MLFVTRYPISASSSEWVLVTGIWDDDAFWNDDAIYKD